MAYSIPITDWGGGSLFSLPDASLAQGANTALWNNPYKNWYNGAQGGEGWENVASPLLQNMTALDPYGYFYGGTDASGNYRYMVPQSTGIRDPNDPTRSIMGDYSAFGDVFGTSVNGETPVKNTWGLLPEGTTDPYSQLKLYSAATPQDKFGFGDLMPMLAMAGLGAIIPGGFMGVLGDFAGSLGGSSSWLGDWGSLLGGSAGDTVSGLSATQVAEEMANLGIADTGSGIGSWLKDMPRLAASVALAGSGGGADDPGKTTPAALTKTLPAGYTPAQTGTYQGGSYVPKWGNYGQYNSAFGNAQASKLLGPYANMAGLGGKQQSAKGGW